MYARLLFVVVGIFGPVLARLLPCAPVSDLRLGIAGACGYTLAA